jgi:exodeoxyribonuclease VII small subunit
VTDRESISYEQARDELAAVVRRLEAGGLTLEQSLDLWERGEKLAAVCAEWLDGARARLTTAMAARDATDAGGTGGAGGRGGTGGRGDTQKTDGPDAEDVPF